jgi:hypothetical protein
MSLTVTRVIKAESIGARFMSVSTIDFDSSYPTGGEPLTPADLGFASTSDPELHIEVKAKGGYVFEYDHANQKVLAYRRGAITENVAGTYTQNAVLAAAALAEVADTADLSAVTGVRVVAYGKFKA